MEIPKTIINRKIRYDLSIKADIAAMLDVLCEIYKKEKNEMLEIIILDVFNAFNKKQKIT